MISLSAFLTEQQWGTEPSNLPDMPRHGNLWYDIGIEHRAETMRRQSFAVLLENPECSELSGQVTRDFGNSGLIEIGYKLEGAFTSKDVFLRAALAIADDLERAFGSADRAYSRTETGVYGPDVRRLWKQERAMIGLDADWYKRRIWIRSTRPNGDLFRVLSGRNWTLEWGAIHRTGSERCS